MRNQSYVKKADIGMLWAAFIEGCRKRKNLEELSAVREVAEPRS